LIGPADKKECEKEMSMLKEELRVVIKKRTALDPEYDYGIEQCCLKEIEILTRDICDAIAFLENECTGQEFVWISEVFDEVVEKTQSREFIDCLYRMAKKFPGECEKYNILYFIDTSKDFLKTQ